ncbi:MULTISPECIES: hypothetical protein [unclassified Pseudomonas]|uniref:hypothetical protein n=1 Tax=unclassified Pseudomonas TaxID=196821 RepID=UPI001B33B681|nr:MULTISPECIES: hypothetical protein [unclassified Pseudomonas]MBP5945959.1 hypothetical protein [Pseudomonas sp. P9(2020)]MBZ9564099.1 hypothetical protein [Pseudomonas sp. P116]
MFDEQIGISRIEVKLDSTRSGQHKVLYANGRMQVRVLVLLHGIDNNGDGASLYGHPALQTLRLIAYNGARALEGDWQVSVQENRYNHEMSGGVSHLTEVAKVTDNRISSNLDPVQIFEFWVSATKTGIMEVAAEIVMNEEVLRSNGLGFDSSVTLEAIPPKEYSLSDFSVSKYGDQERRDRYDWIQTYHIALHAEGRQISLLDWYSSEVRLAYYDSDTAVQVYVSGNIPDTEDNRRCFYGYMAPMYKRSATFRSPRLGYMTVPVNKVAGRLTLIQYISADSQEGGENKNGFEFSVFDEFGTEHRLCLEGDKEQRTFILVKSKRPMQQFWSR